MRRAFFATVRGAAPCARAARAVSAAPTARRSYASDSDGGATGAGFPAAATAAFGLSPFSSSLGGGHGAMTGTATPFGGHHDTAMAPFETQHQARSFISASASADGAAASAAAAADVAAAAADAAAAAAGADSEFDSGMLADPTRVLITGALGQIGTELIVRLRGKYGKDNIFASDIKKHPDPHFNRAGPFVYCDVKNYHSFSKSIVEHRIDWLVHNSSILSAAGEENPLHALGVNIEGVNNAMDVAKTHDCRIFVPSSIAVYGVLSERNNTPEETITNPNTIYGVSKVYMELLGRYYTQRFGVDFRSLRYPGILSYKTLPGGGTTDYAVQMMFAAAFGHAYECWLEPDTQLPMMYIDDCIRGTIDYLEADVAGLGNHVYNVTAMSFTPAELADELRKHVPDFTVTYRVNPLKQGIAASWPRSLDDTRAGADWGWRAEYDLPHTVEVMLAGIRATYGDGSSIKYLGNDEH